jgi:hypothetical protein
MFVLAFTKGVTKMNNIRLTGMLLAAAVLFATVVQAESNEPTQPGKLKHQAALVQPKSDAQPKAVASAIPGTQTLPEKPAAAPSRQGCRLVTDAIGSFGGTSASASYWMPVNSGGQSSPVGTAESANWGIEAGYVHAVRVTRGDLNADGIINVGDVVYMVNYLYRGGEEPCPVESGDVNNDGIVNVGDVVFLVNYLYRGGDPPPC